MKTKRSAFCIILVSALICFTQKASAQVGIGITSPDPSSVLHINSITKGVLLPRLTEAERNSISSPAAGLLIFQTDGIPGFYYYLSSWQPLTPAVNGFADTALSNLTDPTKINQHLLPFADGTINLGSLSNTYKELYLTGDIFLQGSRFITARGSNNFIGTSAGNTAVFGSYNTATGPGGLQALTTGNWNTANGNGALTASNNCYSNTGTGFQALIANTTGSYNTAVGVLALGTNTTGIANSAFGVAALNNLSSGSYNAASGYFAGAGLSSGNYNSFLGSYADCPAGSTLSNATAIGYGAVIAASNSIRVGNTSVSSIGGQVNWTAFSDGRFKKNIKENVPGLEFINKLRPVTYNLDVDGIDQEMKSPTGSKKQSADAVGYKDKLTIEEMKSKQEKSTINYTGFIAQEVEEAARKMNYDFSGVDAPKNSNDFYGLRYGDFVVPLVKAVQELSNQNKELKLQIAQLQQQVNNLASNAVK